MICETGAAEGGQLMNTEWNIKEFGLWVKALLIRTLHELQYGTNKIGFLGSQ